MKNTILVSATATALVLTSCKNPADSTTDAQVSGEAEVATADSGTKYVFTDASSIKFIGSKVTGSHEGGFKQFDGHFVVKDDEPVAGEFTIDMTSTWSDNEDLTKHLKSEDFFNVDAHPQSKFQVTAFENTSDDTYQLSGNLTLNGVTKNITFPTQVTTTGDSVSIQADFDINRKDWKIVYPGKTDDLIRNEVVINLNLIAEKAS